jgi:hypothetical protein
MAGILFQERIRIRWTEKLQIEQPVKETPGCRRQASGQIAAPFAVRRLRVGRGE